MDELDQLMEALGNVNKICENIQESRKLADEQLTYIRFRAGNWKGVNKYTIWKILLDQSKSIYCIRDRKGFTTKGKPPDYEVQIINAPARVKDMILSKDKGDQGVGEEILNNLADAKYKSKSDE